MSRHRRAEARGRWAERIAAFWLSCKGYRILDRRAKTAVGEIDLVAQRGDFLAFIEVKARASTASAVDALGPRQRERIIRAAGLWRGRYPAFADLQPRYDLVLIVPGRLPDHRRSAWQPEGRLARDLI